MNFTRSNDYYKEALRHIPVGTQVFSKSFNYQPIGASPLAITNANGCKVTDVDGNTYTDWVCGLGPITLGYNYPVVNNAIISQLRQGITFSLPSPLELEMARLMTKVIPGAKMVRFLKSGSEACMASVRVARAFTSRDIILSCSYHGWASEFACVTERRKGIPRAYADHIVEFPYNDLNALEKLFKLHRGKVACVIMEPVVITSPTGDYLKRVKELCRVNGALLIFDEVVTGFRWSLGGAAAYFNVAPDLTVLGKGMSNGMPLSAVCGSRAVMCEFEDVMISSTFGGECLSLAAGIATVNEMINKSTIIHCTEVGLDIKTRLSDAGLVTDGYPCRPRIVLPDESPEAKTLFLEQMIQRGHLLINTMVLNICYSHTADDAKSLVLAVSESMEVLKEAIRKGCVRSSCKGQIIRTAFKRL